MTSRVHFPLPACGLRHAHIFADARHLGRQHRRAHGGTPSPHWGEGGGEGVTGLTLRRGTPSPCPSPQRGEGTTRRRSSDLEGQSAREKCVNALPQAGRGAPAAALAIAIAATLGGTSALAADRELGQYLSSECVTCHQLSGKFQGIPPIVGWPDATFVAIMNEYRSKRRENPVMQTVAGKLSQEEIAALAAYFGSLRPQSQ